MSKEWWYVDGGERKGPLSFEEARSLVAKGTLIPGTLVWKKGMEGWRPVSEISEFGDTITAIPPEVPRPTQREGNIELPSAGPWRRFFARIIDLWIIMLPVSFTVSYLAGSISLEFALWVREPGSEYVLGLLLLPIALLVESIIYGLFGTTLGKAILGIKVVTITAHKATAGQYLERLLGVYWGGLAIGVPFINLFTMFYQYRRVRRGKQAGYDEGKFNVKSIKLGFFRIVSAILMIVGLLFVQVGITAANQVVNRAHYSGTYWTNAVTGSKISIPSGWIHERHRNEDGQRIDMFFSSKLGVFAMFAKEDIDSSLSLEEYVRIWVMATEDDMTFSVPSRPISVQGRAGLRLTGHVTDDRTHKLDAVIVKSGRHVWRLVLLGTSGRNPVSEEVVKLRNLLLSSIG